MNKHLHRIIFNAARGQRMVVSEVASSHGCGGGDTGQAQFLTSAFGCLNQWLSPIALAIAALAASAWYLPVHAQIIADPKAPGNQRPTVLPAANGVPVVNIQTPSAAGVSRDTYSQFDVHAQGAVLNNSRTNVQTQQAGWVGANPWLATGSARVILNEVNSSNPSHLNGYVEVAGQRAEVILANPAGIQVNGGGFINAAGVTLTTGTPVMQSGSLDSFLVRGGQINVTGLGLDTSTADATRILARAVQVNASIWAKDLTAVVGSNQVKALVSGGAATATKVASLDPASTPMPAFALDVASIGGMYAGKIYMVGTDTFNKSRTTVRNSSESTTAVGSSLGGKTVEMQAGKDIAITASQVISDQGTSLVAKDNVAITAGLETSRESQFREEKKSGVFSGVRGDLIKLAGTRNDLDLLCGKDDRRCTFEYNPNGSIDLTKPVTFVGEQITNPDGSTRRQTYDEFVATADGQKMVGATGGIQGIKGTLFGWPYGAGSWPDKLLESFSGSHDMIGGKVSGLYDEQGNIRRGMSDAERAIYDNVITVGAIPLAAPFAAAELLSPAVWQAISIFLKGVK